MLFAFVDESANKLHYRTVGLVVRGSNARALAAALDDVVERASHDFTGVRADFELHGHDLFAATEEWSTLKSVPRARIAIYRQALDAVVRHAEAIYVEGLERNGFRDRYSDVRDEHLACLLHLLEKLDKHANRRSQDLVVVADEHHAARAAQDEIRRSRTQPVWGFRGRPLRIVDTVYFVPSDMSRLVQAADLVAFLHQRISDVVERDARAAAANESLWSALAPLWGRSKERLWRP